MHLQQNDIDFCGIIHIAAYIVEYIVYSFDQRDNDADEDNNEVMVNAIVVCRLQPLIS